MHRLPKINYYDIERIIEFDFVRATEAAALNSLRWLGRGDKEAADAAACDAMRGMFDLMNICGEVVIGEGIKDDAPIAETLAIVARAVDKRVQDVVVMMLDRPRHKEIVEQIRACGASLRMIGDGDIAAAMAPSLPESDVDLYMGIGGSPEAVLAAAGIKCLGGEMQCKMWPRDEKERKQLIVGGNEKDLEHIFTADDLAQGENIVFCATGISDSALLRGVKSKGTTAITHSILMRAKSKTVRLIRAMHNLQNKTIRLRSDNREHLI